jgi:hypothetical protein
MHPKDLQGCCRCRTLLSCPHHGRHHRFLERPQGRSGGRFRSGFPRARHLWASSVRSLQGARCPLRSLACPVTRSKPRRVHMMYARPCACMCVHAHACCSSTHTWDAKGVAGVFWSGDQAQPDDVDGDHPSEASDGDSSPCTHAIMRHESCTHYRQSVLQVGTQSTAIHPSVPASTELRNEVRGCESATKISVASPWCSHLLEGPAYSATEQRLPKGVDSVVWQRQDRVQAAHARVAPAECAVASMCLRPGPRRPVGQGPRRVGLWTVLQQTPYAQLANTLHAVTQGT